MYYPMLAKLCKEPFNSPNYYFEPKIDGMRALAHVTRDGTTLYSRFGESLTSFPDITSLPLINCESAWLDGEIYCTKDGIPNLQLLQTRMHRKEAVEYYAKEFPAHYAIFDIIETDGKDLTSCSLSERKYYLSICLESYHRYENGKVEPIVYPIGFERNDGIRIFQEYVGLGWEGVVAKQIDSTYDQGKRNKKWLKVKKTSIMPVYLCGLTVGLGKRSNTFGSILIGTLRGDKMVSCGEVGTGFTEEEEHDILAVANEYKTHDPVFHTTSNVLLWCTPIVEIKVSFQDITNSGILRHAVYQGFLQ